MSVYNSASEAGVAQDGYWLTKRRDGRSDYWMIARYDAALRSVVYQSSRTTVLEAAKQVLRRYAAANDAGVTPPKPRASTHVYFIQADTGQIKIGVARDIADRLMTLRTMCPVGLNLLASAVGGHAAEFAYHKRFAAHRLHGEWFERHPDILAEIDRLQPPPPATMLGEPRRKM